eukprot:CAMPEP_0177252732 /NCGR_PEP_ID=MMETSP0367-20130122/54722_1 /TAXON_ID=447022 ORGANISM="Scrippsiella hangoei-like, Strain SHHI-4" /NCGR_SAMPLE_ID=MMETSP0367 /ASSEMBLY_ACC=CAM_ASM_000362 /LENGTH=37 /DNA_ID= /DNA_START= /DNA_END= /DNA_ORIENTATION=
MTAREHPMDTPPQIESSARPLAQTVATSTNVPKNSAT